LPYAGLNPGSSCRWPSFPYVIYPPVSSLSPLGLVLSIFPLFVLTNSPCPILLISPLYRPLYLPLSRPPNFPYLFTLIFPLSRPSYFPSVLFLYILLCLFLSIYPLSGSIYIYLDLSGPLCITSVCFSLSPILCPILSISIFSGPFLSPPLSGNLCP
jgi:hypothetical protein